jgi:hypothetical protein
VEFASLIACEDEMVSGLLAKKKAPTTLSALLALALLAEPKDASAQPWTLSFGNCTFSGNNAGAPLVRAGSCPSQDDWVGLDLRSRFITSLPANVFEGMSSVKRISLGNNQLVALPTGVFSGLGGLTLLDLSGNALGALTTGVFSGLGALTSLDLSGNALSTLPVGVFDGLGALRTLYVVQGTSVCDYSVANTLQCVPISSGIRLALTRYSGPVTCTSVPWTVSFGNCSFSGDYAGAPLVRAGSCPSQAGVDGVGLDLRSRSITSLPGNVFEGMSSVKRISLGNNQLVALPTGVFSGLGSLTSLDLSANALSTLPVGVFDGLTSFGTLDLSANALSTLPVGVSYHASCAEYAAGTTVSNCSRVRCENASSFRA